MGGIVFFAEWNGGNPSAWYARLKCRVFKASNLERHFTSLHANMAQGFPQATELCKQKVNTLKHQSEKQTQFFQKFTKQSETITLTAYQVAWNIARAEKPYSEGEFVKTCLSDVILTPENDNLKYSLSHQQLSWHTVKQRILDINNLIGIQLCTDLEKCQDFSIALDGCCNIQDKPSWQYYSLYSLCQKTLK